MILALTMKRKLSAIWHHWSRTHESSHRLEHLGDTVLNMVITNYLQKVYPLLRVGPSTVRLLALPFQYLLISSQKIRSLVVGNFTLAAM
jgi:hypothetical protein